NPSAEATATRPPTRRTSWRERELLGARRSGARRPRSRRNIARREGALEQVFEIGALTVLHIVDVPRACGGILDLFCQLKKPPRRIDVTRLRGHHQNGIYPVHRQHANNTGEGTLTLSLQYPFELAGSLRRVAVAHREQGVGLARQNVD